ncbi:hypothetical protein NDU88_008167 [Pleurodeles waltl]|uniref:Uncharacterized protein n=1 Tax=Pleurodeles waltl TaxID=8319 RepID=A0AAV7RUE7_PLEWA|nr:hypothetical protein NDU88_008167 [Pleurodeles waltl]
MSPRVSDGLNGLPGYTRWNRAALQLSRLHRAAMRAPLRGTEPVGLPKKTVETAKVVREATDGAGKAVKLQEGGSRLALPVQKNKTEVDKQVTS